jgi:hypothetical protein
VTAQDVFRAMLRDDIAPALRRMGFKGSGQAFILPSETHWALLSFQKSMHSTSDSVRFAVNYDVTTKEEWENRRRTFGAPKRPTPSWLHNGSIGDPPHARGQVQHWWILRVEDPTAPLAAEVLSRIHGEALPAMRSRIDSPT